MRFKKATIPRALKEAVWLKYCGKVFETKCSTTWCPNPINVYDFHTGHRIPESKGGSLSLQNLVPICARCNLSMGSQYTFDQWCSSFKDRTGAGAGTAAPTAQAADTPPSCFSFLTKLFSFCTTPPSASSPQQSSSAPPSKSSKTKELRPYISPTIRA